MPVLVLRAVARPIHAISQKASAAARALAANARRL
jgi:hypothetical protein